MSTRTEKNTVPLSKFRASYKKCLNQLKESRLPLAHIQNGSATAVVFSPREYDRLHSQQAKMNLIASRLQEIANSQFADDEAAMWEELES